LSLFSPALVPVPPTAQLSASLAELPAVFIALSAAVYSHLYPREEERAVEILDKIV